MSPPDPTNAGIAEDAIAGVEAGRNGEFGLVLGVDRTGAPLAQHGANWVITDFHDISADQVIAFFAEKTKVA